MKPLPFSTIKVKTAIPLSIVSLFLLLLSCGGNQAKDQKPPIEGDSLYYKMVTCPDTARKFFLVDSLVASGDLPYWVPAIMRNEEYKMEGNYAKGIEVLKEYVKYDKLSNIKDSLAYYNCISELASNLYYLNRVEESLKIALGAVGPLDALGNDGKKGNYSFYDLLMKLYDVIAKSQMSLGMKAEAEKSYEQTYKYAILATKVLSNQYNVGNAAILTYNTILLFHENEEYAKAEKWLHRQDSLTNEIMAHEDIDEESKDYFKALYEYNHAINALGLNKKEEAEQAFSDYQQTQFAQTDGGRIDGSDYLRKTGRLNEAADAIAPLEEYFASQGLELSLDLISKLGEKFRINYKIGRKDVALATANYVFENLDSVIQRQKRNDMAEMATIYETNKKDAEIAQQQIELTQQRVIGLIIAIVLLTIFFIIYTLVRRRAAKRLAEMKAAQERIESELRIARDIQMSMVPSSFPDYEGLDMFASMTPAKEVGGDLYGYVLLGDKLYFALGDVSGKGVPASLFMAQATRLFRTLAVQQMKPAEICTRMNNALSGEDNESGMFVTFWLGLVDLTTGHLDFCNAGHNPPIIDGGESNGEFLDMIPNAPIGLFPGLDYEGEEIENVKGRQLFIYTDGLNEAENKAQEQFGDDRLLEILRTSHFDSAQQVIDALKAEVEQHRNGADPNDDLTMMCIRIAE